MSFTLSVVGSLRRIGVSLNKCRLTRYPAKGSPVSSPIDSDDSDASDASEGDEEYRTAAEVADIDVERLRCHF